MTVIPLVHESKTQRQHVRVRAPAQVTIRGVDYSVFDWSVAGFSVSGYEPRAPEETVNANFVFAYDGFRFEVDLKAAVRFINAEKKRVGFSFVDLGARELALLQFMIGAYLSGEVVAASDLLAIAGRNNTTPARGEKRTVRKENPFTKFIGLLPRMAVLTALWLAVGLVFFVITTSMFSRIFLVKGLAAVAASETIPATAPISGIVRETTARLGQHVQTGAPIAILDIGGGETRAVLSPCDCVMATAGPQLGQWAAEGAPIATLSPIDSRLIAQAFVEIEDAPKIREGARASVFLLSDRQTVYGHVERVDVPGVSASSYAPVAGGMLKAIVIIRLDRPLPIDAVGQAATARIRTGPLSDRVG